MQISCLLQVLLFVRQCIILLTRCKMALFQGRDLVLYTEPEFAVQLHKNNFICLIILLLLKLVVFI